MFNNNIYIILLLSLLLFSHTAYSYKNRVALVIGNSDYKDAPLKNPVNDADAMSSTLSTMGFKVIIGKNLSRREMYQKIREFGNALKTADVGLFYFAGHGIQYEGQNYLIPVKSNIVEEDEVKYESINAGAVLEKMESANSEVNILILDACRNNPFARSYRSATRGLTRIDGPKGSLIAYATAPGSVAADGEGNNGLYTENLIKYMKEPIPVEKVFKKVRIAVSGKTGDKQIPWENSSLVGADFYFTNKGNITINNPTIIQPKKNSEDIFWRSIENEKSGALFSVYLNKYPNGKYTEIARIKQKQFNLQLPRTGKLIIRSNVNGNTVMVNGENKGSTKLDLDLKPGVYYIEVSKIGYQTFGQSYTVKAGSEQVLYAKLKQNQTSYFKPVQPTYKPTQNTTYTDEQQRAIKLFNKM